MPSLTDPRVPGRQRRSKKLSYYLAHRQASPLEVMLGAARWYHRRAVRATERIEAALELEDGNKRDQLAAVEKLLTLAVHRNTSPEEATLADAKAEELRASAVAVTMYARIRASPHPPRLRPTDPARSWCAPLLA
jgi:hypothetical protein